MYTRINTARVKASKEEEFAEFGNTEEVHAVWKMGKGFLGGYLLQSLDDPQVFISCTLWETPEDCQAFFASAEYRTALGGVAPLMETLPEGGVYAARAEYNA